MNHDIPPDLPADEAKFDFDAFPEDTLFHDRRRGAERRGKFRSGTDGGATPPRGMKERRVKKERRRRIDPTTFEKQYTEDELEFMNAMQQFKVQSCKSFPSHGDVLRVAYSLGYRRVAARDEAEHGGIDLAAGAVADAPGPDAGAEVGSAATC